MAENIVTGKSYKIKTDADSWDKVSFWTKASDVENNAGQTLQSTVGDIAGLSNNLVTTAGNFALDATQGKALNDKLGGIRFTNQDGNWGYVTPDGTFNEFGKTSVSEFNPDYTVFQFGSNSWGSTAGQSYNAPSDGYVKYMLCGAGSGTMQFLLDGTVKGSSTGRNLVTNIIQVSAGQQCQLRLASGSGAWAGAGAMTFYTL